MRDIDPARLRSILTGLAGQRRSALLPALHAAERLYGCVPEQIAAEIGAALGVPLAEVHGVIEFYSMFHRNPVGGTIVRVCSAPVCALAGSPSLVESLHEVLNNDAQREGGFTIEAAPCLGLCDHAPACLVGDTPIGNATTANILSNEPPRPVSFVGGDLRCLTQNCGLGHSVALAEYRAKGGYAGLEKALTMEREQIIAEVKNSGLGRAKVRRLQRR
jgi:NADH-quinone oxidoreductase subunit F